MNNQFSSQQFQQNYQFPQQPMMQNQYPFQNQSQPQMVQQPFQMPFAQQQQQFMPQQYAMPQQAYQQFQQQQYPQQLQQSCQQQFPMMPFQQFPQMGFVNPMMQMMPMMPQFNQFNPYGQPYKQMPVWQINEKNQLDTISKPVANETNANYQFKTEFQKVEDYSNETQLEETFPHLLNINQTSITVPQKAVYFIIRSANEDDLHKAIKYKIWTSTSKSNQVLSQAWRDNEKTGIPIYLFFAVFNQKQFYGVAKMVSDVLADKSFKYWAEGARFFGLCNLEWIFVKTIEEKNFMHLQEYIRFFLNHFKSDGQQIFALKDCHQIKDNAVGKELFSVFMDALNEPNLISNFVYYDRREDILVDCRDNEEFESRFNQLAQYYSQKQSSTKRLQNEEKEVIYQYSAKDQTVNFNDGKELHQVFVVKSKKQSQKQMKKGGKKAEDEKKGVVEEPKASTKKQEALQEYEKEKAKPILYESDDEEPEIEKIENKMDYDDDEEEGEEKEQKEK